MKEPFSESQKKIEGKQKKKNKRSCHLECDNFVIAGLTCLDEKASMDGFTCLKVQFVRFYLLHCYKRTSYFTNENHFLSSYF